MLKGTFFSKLTRDGGFTLVEFLVTLGIIGVFLGGGILNLRRLNERQQVEGAARLVETAIRDAQKQASAGVKPAACSGANQILAAYRVRIGAPFLSNRQYRIEAICWNPTLVIFGTTETLEEPLQITTGAEITFLFENKGQANANSTLCLQNTQGSYFFQVEVTTGGSIRIREVNSC